MSCLTHPIPLLKINFRKVRRVLRLEITGSVKKHFPNYPAVKVRFFFKTKKGNKGNIKIFVSLRCNTQNKPNKTTLKCNYLILSYCHIIMNSLMKCGNSSSP